MELTGALRAARSYLKDNPREYGRAARGLLGLRLGVPMAALRWLSKELEADGKIRDVKLDPAPPGLRFGGSVDPLGTPLRVAAMLFIERVKLTADELTIVLRVEDLSLKMDGEASTPVATLVKSGVLDLSKPGNLIAHLPKTPPMIAEAKDNRITLDLMRNPKLGRNPLVRHAVGVITSFLTVQSVHTDENHIDVAFRALPRGVRGAAGAVRSHVVLPSLGKLLPGG